jgi:hypothetical protein
VLTEVQEKIRKENGFTAAWFISPEAMIMAAPIGAAESRYMWNTHWMKVISVFSGNTETHNKIQKMKVKIGKLLPDGTVRHIEAEHQKTPETTIHLLKNFYSTEKRIDALLDLGTLSMLGATPYRKKRNNSEMQCRSYIRDEKRSSNKYEAKIAGSKELFLQSEGTCFLYQNGCWEVETNKNSLAGLTIYRIEPKGGLSSIETGKINWRCLAEKSKKENQTYYLFRDDQLVTIIFKPQIQ